MKKYELTSDSIVVFGVDLFRIKALIGFGDVKAGDLGGYIQSEENLAHDGNAWVSGGAWVFGDAQVFGNAQVFDNARVFGNAWVSGNAWVFSGAWKKSPLYIQGTRYAVCMCGPKTIKIGCQERSIKQWLKHGKKIAEKCGESALVEEYEKYVRLACQLYAPELLEEKRDI